MSIRTTVAPFHDFYNFYYVPVKDEISPLVVPLLLDFFTQHHSELSKLKIRVFFEIAFFSSLCLPRAIKEIPNCANDIKFFFQKTLSYFEDRIALTVEKSSSLEALAFLCTQWQRALTYLQHEGISHIGQESTVNLLKSVRNKIKQLLKDPDFQKNGLQQQLLLGLMDSYHIESLQPVHPQTLVKDVITSIATYYHLATSEEEGNFLTPAFLNSALSIPIKFRKTIHDTLKNNQEFTNSLFNEIAVNYGVKIPKNTPWNIQEFPVYQCQFNQDILEIDVLTGRFLHNGKEITTLYQSMRNASKSYIELFGEKTLTATDCKAYLKASDDLGEIQIFTKHIDDSKQISEIRRKINGKWYTHIPALDIKSHPPLPPLIGKENLSLWICQEDEKHYLLTDRQTLTPTIRLDLDGRLTFLQEDPNLRWECIGSESLKRTPILDLDPSAFMLQEDSKNIPRNLRLIFPNLIDSSGENIQCERRLFPDSAEPRWVIKSKPHLFLSKEQLLPGIRNFNQFLIIENFSGSREALIPLKTKKQIDAKDTVSCSCVSVNLKGNTLSSPDPKANLYLAYLTLIHSKTSEDYEMAMKFLQCARKFESYDEEELRLLGWIFHSQKMTNDGTVHASAIKLFASWLVTENFKRNPDIPSETLTMSSETLEATNPPCDWMMFWREKIPKENLPSQIQELACFYFARQQHLPLGMRMQDVLTTQELIDWKLNQFILEGRSITDTKTDPKVNVTSSDITLINEMELSRRLPEILVPGRPFDSLENEFPALLNAALSQDPQTRALAEKQLAAMRFDPYSKLFSKILGAALHSHKNEDARNVINFVYKIINTPSEKLFNPDTFRSGIRSYSKEEQDNLLYPHLLAQELETLLSKSPDYFSPLRTSDFDLPLSLKADIFPSIQPIVLPSKIPPSNQLLFKPATSLDVPRFERLFHSAFEVVHQDGDIHIKPFEFETEDPWLKQCIENINEDYLAGAEKNHRIPHYKLKEGKLKNLIDHQYPAITQEATHYSEKVITKAQDAILKLANKLPSDKKSSLKHQMESASGRKKLLSIKDCVQLFLRGDLETYQIATSLNEHEIQELDNLIGNYILISTKANRYREVLKRFEKIKKIYESDKYTQTEIEAALQHLAEELKINKSVDPVQDPRAFMVFEYVLNMTLRDHQVEGLREMIKTETGDVSRYRSVLLQRIQGGGKSLVFGHIMAQFKADGYHLSVHIPTTSQYQTSLYDMSARSDELYQQRERTLVFDDDPLKFTEEYLTWIKKMLKGAIVNREYVTLTNETLRALRCKYLKTRFEILKAPPERNVTKLEECNQILKEILILLRSRGIFTFDEVHKAYDPLIELNMPYGLPEKPLNAESRLISQIIILACLPNEQGRIWIDLEHSAQQSKEDFNGMIDQIIEGLLTNPSWNQPGIRDYLSGKVDDVPSFLETGDNEDLMKLIILARQMLAGNWLKERLATNVNEHHGVPLTGFPRVSIPFRANMNPAIGSEFTDPYVMTTNTMIAYLVTGLNEQQARELLEIFRKSAEVEKRGLAEKSHFISLHEAPSSLIFKEITNLDLFRIDREKQEDIQTLQAALLHALKHPEKNKKEAAMNFFFDYIITKEINGVELYENQVCSNGQNVASMCKSFVAYSGSMENLNIAPIGSIAKPERGTNGQTIDLLIRHKTPVKIVKDGNIQSLFKMMSNHPQSQDIHAIMDVGAFFRGQKNEVVAKMICEHLTATHSEIQGVLFFDTKENLCFMQRDVPHTIKKISMTTPEAIKAETGFEKSQLFTYYDQVHITGVDIAQDDHAIGIFTMHEQTPIHEILQAVRRLRKMDQAQRLLAAIPEGVIKNIETILKKSYRSNEFPSIDDLLLYANIIETGSQKGENLIFCLQKMENIFQQYILDKLYELDVHEEGYLFEKCSYLFEKNVTIDLHKEFAHKREGCPMPLYLETIKQTLMQPLIEILSNNELDGLNHLINSELLNEDRLKELDATVSVPHGFSPKERINTSINSNRTSSRVQSKQNVRSNEKMQVSDQENITDFLNQIESLRLLKSHAKKESIFSKQMFFSKDFGHPAADIDIDSSQPVCWSLNSALKLEKTSFPIESQFNDGLVCTSNAASTVKDHINLTGPYRKKSCPLLVICDTGDDGSKKWKVVLCSIKDAVTFDSFLKPKLDGKKWTINSRNNREMWLVRNKGNLIAGSSELDLDNNPELSLMMTQALFLEGDFEALSAEPWKARIMSWFSTLDIKAKKEWIRFFEEEILMGFPPGYKSSYLYDYFHTNSWSRSK